VDVAIFGHSHQPLVEQQSDLLLLNPGSPTDQRWAPYRSLAHLELGPELRAELVRLD
jgi:predicted phosphodiesterase